MEIRFSEISFLIVILIAFSACDKFEMRGFIASYESVNDRFDQSIDWNSHHPYKQITTQDDNYAIFAMGDSHVGTTENLHIFFNDAIRTNAIAAVLVGDLTTGHTEDYQTFHQSIPNQDSLLTFPIVGNHDLYFNGWEQFHSLFGSTVYLFTVKTPQASDLYICLDTGSGTLGSNQLEWLKEILDTERSTYRHCVIFTHNNLFRIRHTPSTNPLVEELHVLMELCVTYQINMVVTGHDHVKNDVTFGETTHITMDALQDESRYPGFLKLLVKPDRVTYEFVDLHDYDG